MAQVLLTLWISLASLSASSLNCLCLLPHLSDPIQRNFATLKMSCDWTPPTWINQDNLPIIILLKSAKSLPSSIQISVWLNNKVQESGETSSEFCLHMYPMPQTLLEPPSSGLEKASFWYESLILELSTWTTKNPLRKSKVELTSDCRNHIIVEFCVIDQTSWKTGPHSLLSLHISSYFLSEYTYVA